MIDPKLIHGFAALVALTLALVAYQKEDDKEIFWALIAIYFAIRAS